MKKLISIAIIALMALTISFNAMATEFVPSVSNKGAPDVVTTPTDDGDLIGVITDGEGNELSKEYEDCIIITPVKDADTSTEISDEAREKLKEAFDKLNEPGAKLSDLCPELQDIIGDNISLDDLIVMDVFDISSNCENIDEYLNGGDNSLKVTFRLPLEGNQFVTAMVYVNGKWQKAPSVVNNGNGTVTVELNQFGPVAFLTEGGESGGNTGSSSGSTGSTTSPATGDEDFNQIILWGSVMGVSVIAIVCVLVVVSRRKSKNR